MGKQILIVYYSHSMNTKKLAQMIGDITGGDLWELQLQEPYPVDYQTIVAQARKEIDKGCRPQLREFTADIEQYEILLIGTPSWWGTPAPPVLAFLEKHRFAKEIGVFCTHGGDGIGNVCSDIQKACQDAKILPEFAAYGQTASPEVVRAWLEQNHIVENDE